MNPHPLRSIPSVDRAVRELSTVPMPRRLLTLIVRRELEAMRAAGEIPADPIAHVRSTLEAMARHRIQPVINATGILLHTNLGRALLAEEAAEAAATAARHYGNLEYDLDTGQRGSRGRYLELALAALCDAPAATVVNNCAAALVLILRHLAAGPQRRDVLISRGELVQIGGGFRIPEILEASGAVLREVGTTNRTTLDDYARALSPAAAMILKVHRSNFYMEGFVESPATPDLAGLAHQHGIPVVEDLGSGATDALNAALKAAGAAQAEPTPASILAHGVDLLCFSGDKLLGGPQAGIIAGTAAHIAALKKEPFFRALRCDKLVLSALEATVNLHLAQPERIPLFAMLHASVDTLRQRAGRIIAALAPLPAEVVESQAQVGGGSLPQTTIPSIAIELAGNSAEDLAQRLRHGTPPVVGVVRDGRCRLDLRTVLPSQDEVLAAAIRRAIA